MKIIDNFLSEEDFSQLEKGITSELFPWHYSKVLDDYHEKFCNPDYNFQFYHGFYHGFRPTSDYIELLTPFINNLKPKALVRIKCNLTPRTHEIIEHGYHIDQPFSNFTTGIYYLNTNDGYTKFEDGTKVESVANRYVEFDGGTLHTGTTCTNSNYRIVINFNYF